MTPSHPLHATRSHRHLELIYYALALLGLIATWYFNACYLMTGGSLAPQAFFGAALTNALTTAITLDVYLSALVFAVWVATERPRTRIARPWLYIALCFGVGLAIAMPLYLARRERALQSATLNSGSAPGR